MVVAKGGVPDVAVGYQLLVREQIHDARYLQLRLHRCGLHAVLERNGMLSALVGYLHKEGEEVALRYADWHWSAGHACDTVSF